MRFNELKEHCEDEGCNFVLLENNLFMAKNCINGTHCMIEELEFYGIATLCHYFHELNIVVPEPFIDYYHIYTNGREEFNRMNQER